MSELKGCRKEDEGDLDCDSGSGERSGWIVAIWHKQGQCDMAIGRMGREREEIKMTPVCLLQQIYSVCNGAIHCQGGRNGKKKFRLEYVESSYQSEIQAKRVSRQRINGFGAQKRGLYWTKQLYHGSKQEYLGRKLLRSRGSVIKTNSQKNSVNN